MHSRIYNLDETNYTEDEVYDMLQNVCDYADYVSTDCDKKEDIEWLVESCNLPAKDDTITITKEFATKHWETLFEKAKEIIEKGFSFDSLWEIRRTLFNETAFMFIHNGELCTYDEFLKYVARGVITETEFKIYNTWDYHR